MTGLEQDKSANSPDPLKSAAFFAIGQILEPMVDLLFEAGLTVHEFVALVREQSVRAASKRALLENGRISKSRVSIATGLSRSEVARILATPVSQAPSSIEKHPARRVLGAWYDDIKFVDKRGEPAVLPIFGGGHSFEKLVALYSGGTPVRAMLDQLMQINAVDVLSDHYVRVKCRIPVFTGMTSSGVRAAGDRTRSLLQTLIHNLQADKAPFFEGTSLIDNISPEALTLIRRELAEQGAAFLNGTNSLFSRPREKVRRGRQDKSRRCRAGVTIYYFEESEANTAGTLTVSKRKNLSRKKRTTPSEIKCARQGTHRV